MEKSKLIRMTSTTLKCNTAQIHQMTTFDCWLRQLQTRGFGSQAVSTEAEQGLVSGQILFKPHLFSGYDARMVKIQMSHIGLQLVIAASQCHGGEMIKPVPTTNSAPQRA